MIGFLENEPFSDRIENLLRASKAGECSLYLHALQLGELYYITFREHGEKNADLAYARIKSFPILLIDKIEETLLLAAAALKARFPVSYADAFAAALAKIINCPLITGDPEFQSIEKAGHIRIEWLN